jgi:RND family efflux transporter MFP subunit
MKKTMKKPFMIPAVLLFAMVIGCQKPAGDGLPAGGYAADAAPSQPPVPVQVLTLQPSDFFEYGEYYGKVAGLEEKTLVCTAGGSVEAITVKEGDAVAKGQSLGRIDFAKIRTAYDVASLNERISRENHARQEQFFVDGNTSRLAVDQAELAWLNSKSALLEVDKMLEGALCITPIDGVVIARFIDLHQELPPGSRTFTVARMNRIRINIGIPEQEIGGIAIGNEAEVTFAMLPGRTWKGTLQRIGKEVSPETLAFQAEVQVANSDRAILSGITAKVRLARRLLKDQIVVPSEAILTSGGETYVMIEKDGRAQKFPVVTGPADETRTILLQGPAANSRLIIEGNHLVTEDARVVVKDRG